MHAVLDLESTVPWAPPRHPLSGVDAAQMRRMLLQRARRPAYGVTQCLAGVVAQSWMLRGSDHLPLYGLEEAGTLELLEDHFPGAIDEMGLEGHALQRPAAFDEALELDDLVALLTEHLTVPDPDGRHLARAVATACLGANHLWQDMNLSARDELSLMFSGFFTSLAVRNRLDMKWKKFLYKQLCERAEIRLCKAPSCSACADYRACFGSEV